MPSPRKLVLYVVCAIVAFVVLANLFRERLVSAVPLVLCGCFLVDGLIAGQISYGRGSDKRIYHRRENPLAYWGVVALWCFLIVLIGAIFISGTPRPKA